MLYATSVILRREYRFDLLDLYRFVSSICSRKRLATKIKIAKCKTLDTRAFDLFAFQVEYSFVPARNKGAPRVIQEPPAILIRTALT